MICFISTAAFPGVKLQSVLEQRSIEYEQDLVLNAELKLASCLDTEHKGLKGGLLAYCSRDQGQS